MQKSRLTYFILVVIVIILGLLSRHLAGIPLFIGDVLWGLMVYFIIRVLFISQKMNWVITASLLFCYGIEFSQLYQAPWINSIRHTVIGGLILGETFLWGDMLCYTIGIITGVFTERVISNF